MEIGVEGIRDSQECVDPRWPPPALEPGDRGLRRADELREVGLRETALTASVRDLAGDLGEQPTLLCAREPGANSLHGLTHISKVLYIAVVRYALSIAAYVVVVAVYMVSAAAASDDYGLVPGAFLVVLIAAQPLVGFAIGRWWAISLVLLLPIFGIPVPPPEHGYEPIPMWFGMLFFGVPIGGVLIALGVGARKLWNVLRSPSAA